MQAVRSSLEAALKDPGKADALFPFGFFSFFTRNVGCADKVNYLDSGVNCLKRGKKKKQKIVLRKTSTRAKIGDRNDEKKKKTQIKNRTAQLFPFSPFLLLAAAVSDAEVWQIPVLTVEAERKEKKDALDGYLKFLCCQNICRCSLVIKQLNRNVYYLFIPTSSL